MKYIFTALTVFNLLLSFATPAFASNSNVESLLAGQSDLSTFYQALLNTGVARELSENTEYTVFAPTNAAFTELQPSIYPCFYAAQCRVQVAAVVRNHIVPKNESVYRFSRWGGGIPTIGARRLNVEEPFKGQFLVEGHGVLDQNASSESIRTEGDEVSLYRIDGVIASDQELAAFRMQPLADAAGTVTEKTVTTYRTPVAYPIVSSGNVVPGGYPAAPVVYMAPDESSDNITQTTTVTHTTITQ